MPERLRAGPPWRRREPERQCGRGEGPGQIQPRFLNQRSGSTALSAIIASP